MAADRLDSAAIAAALQHLPHWRLGADGRSITRTWSSVDFTAAFALVCRLAALAEAADRHPEIVFGYTRVSATLSTHESGGLTDRDVDLAEQFDRATGT